MLKYIPKVHQQHEEFWFKLDLIITGYTSVIVPNLIPFYGSFKSIYLFLIFVYIVCTNYSKARVTFSPVLADVSKYKQSYYWANY